MHFDFWYGNKLSEITKATCSFSDVDCEYRGNMYIGDKCVGDFWCRDSVKVEETFPGIFGK